MSIFTRINDIINSNIVSMLDRAEHPEKMIRLMIQEMEDTLIEVKSSAAKLIAEKKNYEKDIAILEAEQATWEQKAELAIEKDREDLARGALGEKLRLEKVKENMILRLNESEESLAHLKADIGVLNDKLEDAKQRQKAIIVRQQSLRSQQKIQNTLDKAGSAKAFEKFEMYENNLNRLEGDVEAARLRGGKSQQLKEELENLAEQDSIESELLRLRSKRSSTTRREAE